MKVQRFLAAAMVIAMPTVGLAQKKPDLNDLFNLIDAIIDDSACKGRALKATLDLGVADQHVIDDFLGHRPQSAIDADLSIRDAAVDKMKRISACLAHQSAIDLAHSMLDAWKGKA